MSYLAWFGNTVFSK